jgi:hypothetical protein
VDQQLKDDERVALKTVVTASSSPSHKMVEVPDVIGCRAESGTDFRRRKLHIT